MSSKTKAQLDAENINGTNVGVPTMETVQKMVVDRFNGEYITLNQLKQQRPDIVEFYNENRGTKNYKKSKIREQILWTGKKHCEKVEYMYTGHEAFGGGTMKTATFCFAIFKKEVLNIQLI